MVEVELNFSSLATLREAIAHLGKIIPKSEHGMKEVQAAAQCLTQGGRAWRPGLIRADRCHAGDQPPR
jgi:hypothetical protein